MISLKNFNIIYILKMINETRFNASLFLYFQLMPKKELTGSIFSESPNYNTYTAQSPYAGPNLYLHCTISICWAYSIPTLHNLHMLGLIYTYTAQSPYAGPILYLQLYPRTLADCL